MGARPKVAATDCWVSKSRHPALAPLPTRTRQSRLIEPDPLDKLPRPDRLTEPNINHDSLPGPQNASARLRTLQENTDEIPQLRVVPNKHQVLDVGMFLNKRDDLGRGVSRLKGRLVNELALQRFVDDCRGLLRTL